MREIILIILVVCLPFSSSLAQHYSLSGKIVNESNHNSPVDFAAIMLPDQQLWATANEQGEFFIRSIPAGKVRINISCLGYQQKTLELDIHSDIKEAIFTLKEDNLSLAEVVITAKEKTEATTSSYTIDRTALDHLQTQSIADVTSLLPGGKTNKVTHLASNLAQEISLRSTSSSDAEYNRFGTAVEVDGVRLSTNSMFLKLSDKPSELTSSTSNPTSFAGADVRAVSTTNIESVEVITGVPSVDHGDVSNGMIRINTKQGKTPWNIEVASRPNSKLYALNKGFALKGDNGVINLGLERTKSIADLSSPYTTYDRNGLTLRYSKTFNQTRHPLRLKAGIAGNLGGFDSKADPDAYANTYLKNKSNSLRMDFSLNWLLNKSWITNLELSGSSSFADNKITENRYKSASSATIAIHAMEEGYYMGEKYEDNPNADLVLIPRGHWFEKGIIDNQPRDYKAKLKADWSSLLGNIRQTLLLGGEYNYSKNVGKGWYYETPSDEKYAYYVPTWREYQYKDQPGMTNLSFFAEEKVDIPIRSSKLQLVAGIRSDITSIAGSTYGTVSSFSPRLNARYTFWDGKDGLLKKLSIRAGWGKSVKLPSLGILNPQPTYMNRQSFASASMADGTAYYAYHVYPTTPVYNADLKRQNSQLTEIGIETRLGAARISLTAFYNKTESPYKLVKNYIPYSYNLTTQASLNDVPIAPENRHYAVDKATGIVRVSDKTNANSSIYQLDYKERPLLRSQSYYGNATGSVKKGLEWIADFDKIPALNTSFRLDGSYYHFRSVDKTIAQASETTSQLMADGNFYKYVGYYVGSDNTANGSLNKKLNTNLTIITHIPKIRLIVSLRIEGSLYSLEQNLSEYGNAQRSFILENKDSYLPLEGNIYSGNNYVGMYPLYYSAIEDLNTKIPFKEAFLNAKDNNPALYNELAKLVVKSNTDYFFKKSSLSPYFIANFSVTKEIGKIASISFDARNFTNTTAKVHSSRDESDYSLYGSSYVPSFYYGLSLKIKL